jgi:hypothetical protein
MEALRIHIEFGIDISRPERGTDEEHERRARAFGWPARRGANVESCVSTSPSLGAPSPTIVRSGRG